MFDILIAFSDGTKKIIRDAKDFSRDSHLNCYLIQKNGFNIFVDALEVKYIGKLEDLNELEEA